VIANNPHPGGGHRRRRRATRRPGSSLCRLTARIISLCDNPGSWSGSLILRRPRPCAFSARCSPGVPLTFRCVAVSCAKGPTASPMAMAAPGGTSSPSLWPRLAEPGSRGLMGGRAVRLASRKERDAIAPTRPPHARCGTVRVVTKNERQAPQPAPAFEIVTSSIRPRPVRADPNRPMARTRSIPFGDGRAGRSTGQDDPKPRRAPASPHLDRSAVAVAMACTTGHADSPNPPASVCAEVGPGEAVEIRSSLRWRCRFLIPPPHQHTCSVRRAGTDLDSSPLPFCAK